MPSSTFLKPRIIDVQNISPYHAKVTMEPFERGYGHTLGNALRRVLLSSMVGYAPTEVTIAGVVHEYSSLDGVQEDVVDILLNLKGVVFKLHSRDEVTLSLKKEGEGPVLASDIDLPHDVELINPDHVIAHLTAGGKIDMQVKVEKGRGYVPGSMRRHADEVNKSIGRIVLDASFSPVKRVSYSVERARVEQRTELDKLILDLDTNGGIDPAEAGNQFVAVAAGAVRFREGIENKDASHHQDQRADDRLDDIAAHVSASPVASRGLARTPRFVGRLGLVVATGQGRPRRAVGVFGAALIAQVILLPRLARQATLGRQRVGGVVEPTMPIGRHTRGLGFPVVDHPAAFEAERRINRAAARAVIDVAIFVGSDAFAIEQRPQPCVEGRLVPPGKKSHDVRHFSSRL